MTKKVRSLAGCSIVRRFCAGWGFRLRHLCCALLLACAVAGCPTLTAPAFGAVGWAGTQQSASTAQKPSLDVRLPLEKNSVRFVAIGDMGTGDKPQYDVARQMELYREKVGYDFVIMLGDNIYGGHSPDDFRRKFETPYKPLLDAGVKFYASLGNHDDPDVEIRYKPFGMDGQRYYTFKKGDVEFFALDSNYMDPKQLDWLTKQLADSRSKWKIAYFHHPLYSHARAHGSDLDLRARLQPLFEQFHVNAVLSGHDHVYERMKPQAGIYYFVEGDSGQLRAHDLKRSDETAIGEDTDRSFMLIEITSDKFYFQTITGDGRTIDSGALPLQKVPQTPTAVPAPPQR